jgi:hypothetical protein
MIKCIYLILFVLCLKIIPLRSQTNKFIASQFNSSQLKSEFLLYLSKYYSSNAFTILNKKSDDFYTQWATGKYHYEVLSSYLAVVHETCHAINSDIGGFFSKGFYIAPNIEIKVGESSIFKSSEIDQNIPESWKTNIFRYRTYIQGIKGDKEISSIADGIFGLMDEYDAYYQSTRAVVELYAYYKTIASYIEPYYWCLYLSNCYSSIFAYYEFRLFIAWYLKYAKKNHPDSYKSLVLNKNLKVVFSLIDNGYKKVVEQYFENRKIIFENINKAGMKKAEISDKFFIIKTKSPKGTSQIGYGIPDAEIAFLKSIFTNEDNQMLKMLTIENLTETNYKSFLDD